MKVTFVRDASRPPGLFVVGTDTGVGKTEIACLISRQLSLSGVRVGVYKPVCSGAISGADGVARWEDIDRLRDSVRSQWAEIDLTDEAICPQRFLAPLAPPLAARDERRVVDMDLARQGVNIWNGRAEILIVEGAGGLLSPVSTWHDVADLARDIGYPVIVVARCGLGTINHSLMTIEAARRRGLIVCGVVLNQSHPADDIALASDNAVEIEARSGAPVLGVHAWQSQDGLQRDGQTVTIRWPNLALKPVSGSSLRSRMEQ